MEEENDSPVFLTMEQRTNLVREKCSKEAGRLYTDEGNITKIHLPPRIIVSDRFKLLGCLIDKVGSTNIQRIFYILNGLTNVTDPGEVTQHDARKYTNEYFYGVNKSRKSNYVAAVHSRLKSYTTFMFVRHPLERIVSAYRDNKPNNVFQNWRAKSIVPDFEKYIDILLQNKSHYSKPLRPLYMMCNPCRIAYDFIGSLDSFDSDMAAILQAVGAETAVSIPQRRYTGYNKQRSSDVFEMYFKDIPMNKLVKLEQIYDIDYMLFGFERMQRN